MPNADKLSKSTFSIRVVEHDTDGTETVIVDVEKLPAKYTLTELNDVRRRVSPGSKLGRPVASADADPFTA